MAWCCGFWQILAIFIKITGPMGSIGIARIPQKLTRQQAGARLCSPHPLLSGRENLRNRKTAKNGKSLTDFWVQLSDQSNKIPSEKYHFNAQRTCNKKIFVVQCHVYRGKTFKINFSIKLSLNWIEGQFQPFKYKRNQDTLIRFRAY